MLRVVLLVRGYTADPLFVDLVVQLTIRAQDKSPLFKTATTLVDIYIVRNMYNPRFVGDPYNAEDLKGAALGETIITVSAVDDDKNNPFNRDVSVSLKYTFMQAPHPPPPTPHCTHVCTHKYTHTHTHTHTYCTHACTYPPLYCTYVCKNTHTHTPVLCSCMHLHTHMHLYRTRICTSCPCIALMYAHMCAHTHIHTHTRTHTHTHTPPLYCVCVGSDNKDIA